MKKEIILAIFLGFLVGLAITYGVYTANQAINGNSTKIANTEPSPESTEPSIPTASPASLELTLEIAEPENYLVVKNDSVEIKGNTLPNNFIAILGEEDELIVTADKEGFFKSEISLISGLNNIQVISSNRDNSKQVTEDLEIVYSEAEIK
jgi:hypothetical protein